MIQFGTRLGPYEIRDQIGAGGMGEVYRATDTRLERTVAIKVLPEHLASDPQRRERFEREAKAVSSLNHPHICTLHDVGEQDGTHYLVMELVEGETLEARLLKGRLPLDQALEYAIQIADALDKAHRQGIVHRDLKPGNIMVTKSGVKLLDFGLAKLKGEAVPTSGLSQAPTKENLTAEGTLLGTLQYMAPEQLEGKGVDSRTDVFAFGAVVYEMVVGKKAFEGESQASLIGAILKDDPQPIADLQPVSPHALDQAVSRCLSKDPEDRWQTAADLVFQLRSITAAASDENVSARVTHVPARHQRQRVAVGLVGAATVIALVVAVFYLRQTPAPETTPRLEFTVIPPGSSSLAPVGNQGATPEISPDGSAVLFWTDGPYWVQQFDSPEPVLLNGGQAANNSGFWSADSEYVVLPTFEELIKIRVPDGAPEPIADMMGVEYTRGGSWGETGTILVAGYTQSRGLHMLTVDAAGGELVPVEVPELGPGMYFYPQFLPGGEDILFLFVPGSGDEDSEAQIYVATFEDGAATDPVRLLTNTTAARYTRAGGGQLLFIRNDNLYTQPLDLARRVLESVPELVQEGVASMPGNTSFTPHFSVADSGTLAWRPGRAALSQVAIFDRQGIEIGTAGPPMATGIIALSPDETSVLSSTSERSWLLEAGGPGRLPLGAGYWRLWHPDGSRILAGGYPGRRGLFELDVDGSDEPRRLELGDETGGVYLQDISADGEEILLYVSNAGAYALPLSGPVETRVSQPVVPTGEEVYMPRFSPDGRWIVYVVFDRDRQTSEVYVQPFPGSVQRRRRIANGGYFPVWRSDGQEIAYFGEDSIWSIPVDDAGEDLAFGDPEALFPVRGSAHLITLSSPLALSGDGSRFYFAQGVEQPGSDMIRVKMGWLE